MLKYVKEYLCEVYELFYFGQFCDAYFPVVDGVVMVVKNYAEILNSVYGKCCVVAPGVPNYRDMESFEVIRVKSVPIPQRAPYRFAVAELHKSSANKIAARKFDLIHTHSPFGLSQYGYKVAKRRRIPTISTFHSKYYDDFKQVLKLNSIANLGVNFIVEHYKHMDQVWTVSKSTALTLKDYGYKGNIEIVNNGSDTIYPENADELMAIAAEKYLLANNYAKVPMFLFVGQQIWQKNIKTLIQTMAYLNKAGFDYRMIMTGKGYAENEIRKMVREYGLKDKFIFTGSVMDRKELSGLYLTADLFIFPSVYDNAPLVIREAAGLRTPSMVIENSNAAEGITDGVNGYLVKNDCINIGERIIELFSSGADLKIVGEAAEKTLAVSWDTIVEDVYGRYVELIKYKNRIHD